MELFSFPALYDTAFQFRNASDTVDFIEECVAMLHRHFVSNRARFGLRNRALYT